jgi:FKBP-type peptidyl-prolyl cis-trans isomerase 2
VLLVAPDIIITFAENQNIMSQVKENDTVVVHYTGKLTNGEVFDSSEGREPLEFQMGSGQLIPGFERAVMGMKVEESKTFDIPSAEAYGDLREDLYYEVPRENFPEHINPEPGMRLSMGTGDGREIPVTITNVGQEVVNLDANHPLAGKDLTFEVRVVEIK